MRLVITVILSLRATLSEVEGERSDLQHGEEIASPFGLAMTEMKKRRERIGAQNQDSAASEANNNPENKARFRDNRIRLA